MCFPPSVRVQVLADPNFKPGPAIQLGLNLRSADYDALRIRAKCKQPRFLSKQCQLHRDIAPNANTTEQSQVDFEVHIGDI